MLLRTMFFVLILFTSTFFSSIAAAEENFLSCVLQRIKMSGLVEIDTTDVSKAEEPLIWIGAEGDFWVYVGNPFNEALFPDGIQASYISKPEQPTDNIYRWEHYEYSKVMGNDVVTDWSFAISRDDLKLTKSREEDLSALGMSNGHHVWTYDCRLVTKDDFDRFKADMSAKYMELNAKQREEAGIRESNRKI